jgi:hypothetical protein
VSEFVAEFGGNTLLSVTVAYLRYLSDTLEEQQLQYHPRIYGGEMVKIPTVILLHTLRIILRSKLKRREDLCA